MRRTVLFTGTFLAAILISAIALESQEGPVTPGSETVARPRKPDSTTDSAPDMAPIPSKLNKKNTEGDVNTPNFKVESNLVQIDASVLDNRGNFIPNIPRGNFRILEDDVPQQIKSFTMGEAPMTVALLVEFSAKWQRYYGQTWFQTLQAAYGFVSTLKPQDYIAVIAYDMRSEILSDFSQDRTKTQEALSRMRIPGFAESNLFDALADTEERMKDIEGRKAIVLLSTGVDTFSKLTFDKARRVMQEDGVPIYGIGLMQARRIMDEGRTGPMAEMTFLQADNQMKTFSKETGGQAFFPRFEGEMPEIFRGIQQALRNQYQIGYSPTNLARDGKFRKIKIQLVNPQGDPLAIKDEKGKPIKYQILAKAGYTAPRVVE